MLDASPEVEPIRKLVGKRLMESGRLVGGQKQLDQMLLTLWAGGYVTAGAGAAGGGGGERRDGSRGRGGDRRSRRDEAQLLGL